MSQAQQAEDLFVEAACGVGFPGRLLELGAGDPFHLSSSRYLLERGWSGVLVEASPRTFAKLVDAYPRNPKVQLVLAAICRQRRLIEFAHRVSPVWGDYPPGHWSTIHPGLIAHHDTAESWEKFMVSAITIEDLATALPGPYDYVSIDLEGETLDVVEPVLQHLHPRLCCIEHEGQVARVRELGAAYGYEMPFWQHVNVILQRAPDPATSPA